MEELTPSKAFECTKILLAAGMANLLRNAVTRIHQVSNCVILRISDNSVRLMLKLNQCILMCWRVGT